MERFAQELDREIEDDIRWLRDQGLDQAADKITELLAGDAKMKRVFLMRLHRRIQGGGNSRATKPGGPPTRFAWSSPSPTWPPHPRRRGGQRLDLEAKLRQTLQRQFDLRIERPAGSRPVHRHAARGASGAARPPGRPAGRADRPTLPGAGRSQAAAARSPGSLRSGDRRQGETRAPAAGRRPRRGRTARTPAAPALVPEGRRVVSTSSSTTTSAGSASASSTTSPTAPRLSARATARTKRLLMWGHSPARAANAPAEGRDRARAVEEMKLRFEVIRLAAELRQAPQDARGPAAEKLRDALGRGVPGPPRHSAGRRRAHPPAPRGSPRESRPAGEVP